MMYLLNFPDSNFLLAVFLAVGSNEHAVEGGRHGDLHRDPVRPDTHQPSNKNGGSNRAMQP